MAPFRFRLEQVLNYRKQLEEQAMQRLAEATARRDTTRERIRQIDEEREVIRERMLHFASMDAGERFITANYENALQAERKSALTALRQQDIEVDACRMELVAKAKDRQLLDTLKEKQAKRHARQELLNEQHINDETATLRFIPPAL